MAEPRVFLKENRGRIEENYLEQAKNLPRVFAPVDEKLQKCTEEVALACKYLYAFMPYSDIGNYPFEVFLDYAENGVRLWKENPQVADLPEEIFLNYVLFHRVNEEEIAQCRTYFRAEIGSRNVQRKWHLHVNIYMRLCRTVTLAIIRLKYFWTMRRMV